MARAFVMASAVLASAQAAFAQSGADQAPPMRPDTITENAPAENASGQSRPQMRPEAFSPDQTAAAPVVSSDPPLALDPAQATETASFAAGLGDADKAEAEGAVAVSAAPAALAGTAAAAEVRLYPIVQTVDYEGARYLPERHRLEGLWLNAAEGEKAAAAIEIARFLTAQMLLPEAASFLEAARAEGVLHDEQLYGRWRALGLMVDILAGRDLKITEPMVWDDANLWVLSSQAGPAAVDYDLTQAVSLLQNHSEPVVSALLPRLFNIAMLRGDYKIAEGLLRGAREATALPGTPVYHLMMGRLALAYDMPQEAFDYFARASQGRDIFAQRARIAMADLALARKDPKFLPALRDILLEGVTQWRHDHEALILRARLAQVAEDLGDIPLALDIMGKIRQDHPNTPEATLAHERGALALAAFAVAMDDDAISLETYLISMRNIEAFYRLDPVWPIARQALARAYGRAGLHTAAASEYTALQIDLSRIDAPVLTDRMRAELPLHEAEAWLKAFNPPRAALALALEGLPQFTDLQPRYNLADLQSSTRGVIAMPPDFSDPADLATYARTARSIGAYEDARTAHKQMAAVNGFAQAPAEALHAILLNGPSAQPLPTPGDNPVRLISSPDSPFLRLAPPPPANSQNDTYYQMLQATPAGQAFPERANLFAAINTAQPDLEPLSREISDDMLARSHAASAAARALLARAVTPGPMLDASATDTATDIMPQTSGAPVTPANQQ